MYDIQSGIIIVDALRTHVKISKCGNLVFNDEKYLIFRKLNTQISKEYFHIYIAL
jgi:hypothetical protein